MKQKIIVILAFFALFMTSIQAQQVFEYVEKTEMWFKLNQDQFERQKFQLPNISIAEAQSRYQNQFIPESWKNKTDKDCGEVESAVRTWDQSCQRITYQNGSLNAPKSGIIFFDGYFYLMRKTWPMKKGYCSVVRVIQRRAEEPFNNCKGFDAYELTGFGEVVKNTDPDNSLARFGSYNDSRLDDKLDEISLRLSQLEQRGVFSNVSSKDTLVIIHKDSSFIFETDSIFSEKTINTIIREKPNCVGCTIAPIFQINAHHNYLNQGWSFSPEIGALFRWCNNFYAAPRLRLSRASKWTVVEAPCANCDKVDIAPEDQVTLLNDPENFSPSSGWDYDIGVRAGFEHTPWFNNHFGVYIEADAGYIHTSETDQEYFGLGGGFVYNFEQQGLLKPYARIGYGRYVPFGNRFTASAGTTLHFKNAKDKEVDDLENPINFEEDLEQKLLKELNN